MKIFLELMYLMPHKGKSQEITVVRLKCQKHCFKTQCFCCSQNFLLNHLRNYVAYHCESMCWKEEFKCAFQCLLPSSTDGVRCSGCWWQSTEIDFLIGEALDLTHQIVSLELNAPNGNCPKIQDKYSTRRRHWTWYLRFKM